MVGTGLGGGTFSLIAARYDYQANTTAFLTAVALWAAGNGQST
jgi:hypothetical protein